MTDLGTSQNCLVLDMNGSVEYGEGVTIITPDKDDYPPLPTLTHEQRMERLKSAYKLGKAAQASKTPARLSYVRSEPHVHQYTRLCKQKVLLYDHRPSNGELQPTAGSVIGYDWLVQRECACGDRITIKKARVRL